MAGMPTEAPPYPDRNDIPAALEYAAWLRETGLWNSDEARLLVMLQDDSTAYTQAFAKRFPRNPGSGK